MTYQPNDIVRIIRCDPGAMIGSFVGCEAVVLEAHHDKPGLYAVEIDLGRIRPDRGGQMGPRFIVREDMIEPDVTEAMIAAAIDTFERTETRLEDASACASYAELARRTYRAMRAARLKR